MALPYRGPRGHVPPNTYPARDWTRREDVHPTNGRPVFVAWRASQVAEPDIHDGGEGTDLVRHQPPSKYTCAMHVTGEKAQWRDLCRQGSALAWAYVEDVAAYEGDRRGSFAQ